MINLKQFSFIFRHKKSLTRFTIEGVGLLSTYTLVLFFSPGCYFDPKWGMFVCFVSFELKFER